MPLPVAERPKAGASAMKPFGNEAPRGLDDNGPEAGDRPSDKNASPLTDAQDHALGELAEMLFEEDTELAKKSGSVDALTRGTGKLRGDQAPRPLAMKYL